MVEDNTPTVTARRRKPTRHMRLRLETAKKLRALGSKRKAEKEKAKAEAVKVVDPNAPPPATTENDKAKKDDSTTAIKTRTPKVKKATLATPPLPKAKFRKRQVHKSWLPTHLFHAKRAHMTPPSAPLWRFAIPLTPTVKSYRPTHRASHDRGAVAWDTSYVSTISLEGRQDSVEGVLRALGVGEDDAKSKKGQKWRQSTRVLETFVHEREAPHAPIAPVTLIWCVASDTEKEKAAEREKTKRKLFVRVHPSAFFQLWEELLRFAKVAKPQVSVEDLRFEIGSIEVTGPGATEALLGALWPTTDKGESDAMEIDETSKPSVEKTWTGLAGLTNPAMLPQNALLGFHIQDPRLHHPPRTISLPKTDAEQHRLLELIASWPPESTQGPAEVFDRTARLAASRALPSQKAVNRRKGLATPGQYPEPAAKDPKIPVLLYTSSPAAGGNGDGKHRNHSSASSTWTLLLPWKCVSLAWYSILYYPLSTGQQPRFGGLDEKRQLLFEAGLPWFPADFPGTKAGWEWEAQERRRREDEFKRRPKGKRVSFEKLELGGGKKGEIGVGWACDWERLLTAPPSATEVSKDDSAETTVADAAKLTSEKESEKTPEKSTAEHALAKPSQLTRLAAAQAQRLLSSADAAIPAQIDVKSALATVRLTLLTRGVPQTCARIYRLPSATSHPELRKQWLAQLPSNQPSHKRGKGPKHGLPRLPKDAPKHVVQRRLAQSLIEPPRAGEDSYPACPDEEDLVGFVTTGNFNLGEGQGTGVGSILLERVLEDARKGGETGRVCIVRNAGNAVGRLARWDIA